MMNNELLKRIDESFFFVVDADGQQRLDKLLADCRAEIELLSQSNECLRNQNTALDEILAEYSERKYVPMTQPELYRIWSINSSLLSLQDEFIKRAGLEIKHD